MSSASWYGTISCSFSSPSTLWIPPMVTPSISTLNRLCWLKSPAEFFVVPLSTSLLNFVAIYCSRLPPAGPVPRDPVAGPPAPGFHFKSFPPSPWGRDRGSAADHPLCAPGGGGRARPRDAVPLRYFVCPAI